MKKKIKINEDLFIILIVNVISLCLTGIGILIFQSPLSWMDFFIIMVITNFVILFGYIIRWLRGSFEKYIELV